MKKHIILFFFCLMAMSITVQAQKKHHHGGKHHLEKMKADLDLSDQQVRQIEEMGESLKGEMKAIKTSDLGMEEKHAKMEELIKKKKGLMDGILTAEQKAEMDKIHTEKKAMHKERKEGMKEKRAEMKQFMHEKIKPYMTGKRAELDKQIKKKDRKQIDKLRAIAKEAGDEMKAKHEEMRKKFENGEKPARMGMKKGRHGKHGMRPGGPRGHDKMRMMQLMKEYEAEFRQAETYATKYATEIDRLMEEADVQMKEWKTEMKGEEEHFRKGKKGRKDCRKEAGNCKKGGKDCKKGEKSCDKSADKGEMMEQMENFKRIGFLLMPSEVEDEAKTRETKTADVPESRVYPNPSSDSNTLEINVPSKARYDIGLYNETGSKLKVISNARLDKGSHTFTVDLSGLPPGLYYYVMTNGKEKTSRKFIKN